MVCLFVALGAAGCGSRKATIGTSTGAGSGSSTSAEVCQPVPVGGSVYAFEVGNVRLFASNSRFVLVMPRGDCSAALGTLPDLSKLVGNCVNCGKLVDAQQLAVLESDLAKGTIDILMPGADPLGRVTLSDRQLLFWDRTPLGGSIGGTPATTGPSGPSPTDTMRPISQFFGAVQQGNVCAPCEPPNDCETGPGGGTRGLIRFTAMSCDPNCEQLRAQYCPTTDGGTSTPTSGSESCECVRTCCSQ